MTTGQVCLWMSWCPKRVTCEMNKSNITLHRHPSGQNFRGADRLQATHHWKKAELSQCLLILHPRATYPSSVNRRVSASAASLSRMSFGSRSFSPLRRQLAWASPQRMRGVCWNRTQWGPSLRSIKKTSPLTSGSLLSTKSHMLASKGRYRVSDKLRCIFFAVPPR